MACVSERVLEGGVAYEVPSGVEVELRGDYSSHRQQFDVPPMRPRGQSSEWELNKALSSVGFSTRRVEPR